jgi:hypothetical protein
MPPMDLSPDPDVEAQSRGLEDLFHWAQPAWQGKLVSLQHQIAVQCCN